MTIDQLIQEWIEAQKKAKNWKDYEIKLRNKIVEASKQTKAGTHLFADQLKIKIPMSYKLNPDIMKVFKTLNKREKSVIRVVPQLKVREYKECMDKVPRLNRDYITCKTSQPQIEIIER